MRRDVTFVESSPSGQGRTQDKRKKKAFGSHPTMKLRLSSNMGEPRMAASLAALVALLFVRPAIAQDEPPAEAPSTPSQPGQPPPSPAPEPTQGRAPTAGAPSAVAPAEAPPPDLRPRLLAPRYGEDYYPAMPPEDGLVRATTLDDKRGLRFALHGYFRAPMRITKAVRPSPKPGEGDYNWRTPYLIDDDYFRSGFAYTRVSESDWSELYLSVGNDRVTATFGLQGTLFSDAARPIIDRQLGIAQGWLTYRAPLEFIPFFKARLRVKGGAFWERFGHLPMYDTYIFARIHQMGENVRLELERDKTTLWLQHGIGTHLEDIASNQGLTLLNYASVGASYDRTIEIGGYIFDSRARDKRPLKELTDATISIVGIDVRADTHWAGRFYGATSYISAEQSQWQSPAIEAMHSFGGRGLTENYFGTERSENGTGSLWNVGFQYDMSLADTFKYASGSSPLPWGGDVTASLFGLYSFIQSKQQSPDPLINRDDRKSFKWGADAGWRITDWVGLSTRYDRVVLDVGDSANSFRIISPRLAFYTSFITREMLFIQYSRYIYNERIRLRAGQVQLENFPDDHAFKIQAQMTF